MTTTAASDIAYLARALKTPRISSSAGRLADQARDAGWTHEEYLAAVLSQEVTSREASGASIRIRAAGFGTVKSLEEFNFEHQLGAKRDVIAHLATSSYLLDARNVVLLGPPGTGKTHCETRGERPIHGRCRTNWSGRSDPDPKSELKARAGRLSVISTAPVPASYGWRWLRWRESPNR